LLPERITIMPETPPTPIVPARPEDAAAIRRLTREAYARWVPVIGCEPLPMLADYAAAVRDHRFGLVWIEERLAGLVEMIPAAGHMLIENLAVGPWYQGRGLGRRLVAHAEDVAREIGVGEMRLYTNALFRRNVALYRSLGYRVAREEIVALGVVVHMAKAVRAAVPAK
jgi:GNAT superfamily N-acetyltransferase